MITDRRIPRVTVATAAALLALVGALISVPSAPVPHAGAEVPSSSELTGFQLPTLSLSEASPAE